MIFRTAILFFLMSISACQSNQTDSQTSKLSEKEQQQQKAQEDKK